MKPCFFKTPADLRKWFRINHGISKELWIGFHKKHAGRAGISYPQALDEALCFGWIDGLKKSLDADSYTQRFTPRRPGSAWSRINTDHAKRLILARKMTLAGLRQVAAAKRDGRWKNAYAPQRSASVPSDLLGALRLNRKARVFFETLDKKNVYAACYRLQKARKPETRTRLIREFIKMFAAGRKFHP